MKKRILLLLSLTVLLLFPAIGHAQQNLTITKVQFTRTGGSIISPSTTVDGNFKFLNSNSEISGQLSHTTGAVYTFCSPDGCSIGQTLKIFDKLAGNNNLLQGTNSVVVSGVTYQKIYYKADLTFDAGTIRIPFYAGRKSTIKLTYPVRLTGNIAGYPDTTFSAPVFTANLDVPGTVTVKLVRSNTSPNSFPYQISEVSYNLAAAGS